MEFSTLRLDELQERKSLSILLLFLQTAIILGLSGCSLLKASPTEFAVFVPKPKALAEQRDRAPFNGYWVADPEGYYELRNSYRQVYIEEVDTSYVKKTYLESSGSEETKKARIEEAEQLANYFKAKIKLILEDREEPLVRFSDFPQPETLKLNLALTQVVPTNPGVNFAGTVAGFFVPGGGLIKYFGEGSVAMEGFVEDGKDASVEEQYKDREGQKSSPFTLKDYQRYSHIRAAIDDWAVQLVELLNTEPDFTVEDSLPVSVNPL